MINLRSPHFVKVTIANLTAIEIELHVYGWDVANDKLTQITDRGTPVYTLEANSTTDTTITALPFVAIDISELARDYIQSTFSGTYACTSLWVDFRTANSISAGAYGAWTSYYTVEAFDGYNYFEDGVSSSTDVYTAPDILQSNTTIYKHEDDVVRLPVLQTNVDNVTFLHDGVITNSVAITATTESDAIIRYISNSGASYDTFKARVAADSGTLEEEALMGVFNKYATQPCNAVMVDIGGVYSKLEVKDICSGKYEPYKVTFINKFGALQDLWFFGVSKQTIMTKKDKYKANLLQYGSYSTTAHQSKVLSNVGKETIRLNSGWYSEDNNEVFRQLFFTESAWITMDGVVLPVNIASNDLELKTSVNEKLINYTVDLEFAYDKINSVR